MIALFMAVVYVFAKDTKKERYSAIGAKNEKGEKVSLTPETIAPFVEAVKKKLVDNKKSCANHVETLYVTKNGDLYSGEFMFMVQPTEGFPYMTSVIADTKMSSSGILNALVNVIFPSDEVPQKEEYEFLDHNITGAEIGDDALPTAAELSEVQSRYDHFTGRTQRGIN